MTSETPRIAPDSGSGAREVVPAEGLLRAARVIPPFDMITCYSEEPLLSAFIMVSAVTHHDEAPVTVDTLKNAGIRETSPIYRHDRRGAQRCHEVQGGHQVKKAPWDAYLLRNCAAPAAARPRHEEADRCDRREAGIAMNDRMTKNEVYRGAFRGYGRYQGLHPQGLARTQRGGCATRSDRAANHRSVESTAKREDADRVRRAASLAQLGRHVGEIARSSARAPSTLLDTRKTCTGRVVVRRAFQGRATPRVTAAKIGRRADYYRVHLCYERGGARWQSG